MTRENRILVIGGTACGPKSAARARRCDPGARITIVEQGENLSTATCGLPYYISGVIENEETMVARRPDYFREVMDMEVLTRTRASGIDPKAHTVEIINLETDRHSTVEYDKLVLSMGSVPAIPAWKGHDDDPRGKGPRHMAGRESGDQRDSSQDGHPDDIQRRAGF